MSFHGTLHVKLTQCRLTSDIIGFKSVEVTFSLGRFSAHNCTQTTPIINKLVIVMALSQQLLAQTWKKASPPEMEAMQNERTVFSTHSYIGGQKWPTHNQGVSKAEPRNSHAVCTLGCTHPLPPVPPFLLKQNYL